MSAINFVYIIAIIFSIYVYTISIKNHSSKISDIFILFMLVQIIINISTTALLPIESATLIEWFVAYKLRNLALTFLPLIWLMFLHEYLKIEYSKWIIAFFLIISIFEFIFVLTISFGDFSIAFFREMDSNLFYEFIQYHSQFYVMFIFLTLLAMAYSFVVYCIAVKKRLVAFRWEIIAITVLVQLMLLSELFIAKQVLYGVDITLVYSLFATLAFYRLVVSSEIKNVIPISNSTILENLPTSIIIINPNDIIVYANNKAFVEINSLKIGEKMSNIEGFLSVNKDDQIFDSNSVTVKRNDGTICTYIIHNEFYDGYAIIKLANATEEKRKLEILNTLSSYDALTNVLNKVTFFAEATKSIAAFNADGKDNLYAVFMLDIDFFKKVNDTYGHQVGDKVLSTLAFDLQQHINKLGDDKLVGRFGGEEFCGLVQANNKEDVIAMLEEFRCYFSELEFEGDNVLFKATLSIGVTFADNSSEVLEKLLEEADSALYNAKNSGRNRLVVFSDENL